MKKLSMIPLALSLLLMLAACVPCEDDDPGAVSAKPVIYLYPESDAKPVVYLQPEAATEVTVRLDYDGELTCTYPAYDDGWTVLAQPDGTLTDRNG